MEANGFTQFCQPVQNDDGNWYIRSAERDLIGNYRFLVFGLEGDSPMILTILDAHNGGYDILCQTYGEADAELKFYYTYHKAVDLYNTLMFSLKKPAVPAMATSQPMEFE